MEYFVASPFTTKKNCFFGTNGNMNTPKSEPERRDCFWDCRFNLNAIFSIKTFENLMEKLEIFPTIKGPIQWKSRKVLTKNTNYIKGISISLLWHLSNANLKNVYFSTLTRRKRFQRTKNQIQIWIINNIKQK